MPLNTEEYENALEVGDRVKIINTENVWEDKQGEIINKINDDIYTVGVIFAPGKIVHQDFEKEYLEPLNGGRVEMAEDYKTEYKYTKKLPTRVSISMYDLEYNPEADSEDYLTELINNYLSDNYGYLVSGYSYDVKKDRVIVSNISWDLEESYYDSYKTEDNEVYVYEFNAADINDNHAELLYKYNLTPIGEVKDLNYPEEENNYAVKGKLKDLNKFAYDIYYELHPDYLTLEKDYDYEDREWIEEPNLYEECNYHETTSDDILNEAEDKETIHHLDWDRLYITTLSYNDLDLEVEDTFVEFTNTNDPLSDYGDTGEKEYTRRGVINYWDYYIDLTLDDIVRYLNKDKEEITQRDIDNIDEEDFYDFLLDYYRRDAEKDAAEKHEVDDVYYYAEDDWRDDYERD